MNKKKIIIGIIAGVAAIGSIVTIVSKVKKSRRALEDYDIGFDDDDDFYEDLL